jgi:cytochrome c
MMTMEITQDRNASKQPAKKIYTKMCVVCLGGARESKSESSLDTNFPSALGRRSLVCVSERRSERERANEPNRARG